MNLTSSRCTLSSSGSKYSLSFSLRGATLKAQRQLGVSAAGRVDPVLEDEASPASANTGVRVASSGAVVHGSSADGFYMCAVDGYDSSDECP